MSKESVVLPTTIDMTGVMAIRRLVGSECGIYLTEDLMGGFYRVTRSGKIAKRIRRNLKRELNIDLSGDLISLIGNAANSYSFKDENYLAEYVEDLESIVGNFGDGDSCFRPGRQNHHHLLALMDIGVLAFCVYRSTGENLGRAWCYRTGEKTEVFFNAYGFDLVKIAKIASFLHNEAPVKNGRVEATHDIWINNGGDAYILNGDDKTRFVLDIADPDSFAPYHCHNCDRPLWNRDDTRNGPDDTLWCYPCFRNRFWSCQRCGEHKDNRTEQPQFIHGSGQYDRLCLECTMTRNYRQCDHCTEQCQSDQQGGNQHWYLNMRGLTRHVTADDTVLRLCDGHYRDHVRCRFCGDELTRGQAVEILSSDNNKLRSCVRCASNPETITYCPNCDTLNHRHQQRIRYNSSRDPVICRQCNNRIDTPPALIVQTPPHTEEQTEQSGTAIATITADATNTATITFATDTHTGNPPIEDRLDQIYRLLIDDMNEFPPDPLIADLNEDN